MSTKNFDKLVEGERYWRRDGLLSGTIVLSIGRAMVTYPFKDLASDILYTQQGSYWHVDESPFDLVRLADPSEYTVPITGNAAEIIGYDLPNVMVVQSGESHAELLETIELQKLQIEKLKATIKRKNEVFQKFADEMIYELQKANL